MGIRGATSLMLGDSSRFCEPFLLNGSTEQGKVALLVDAMSLLHYLASSASRKDYLDLATVRKNVSNYASNLLKVVGSRGQVHFCFDGLSPEAKTASQLERFTKRAMISERMARERKLTKGDRIMHHFAQWAFQEAIEQLIDAQDDENSQKLFVHRPRHGEGEVFINHWISENNQNSEWAKIGIISEDTDFLVYNSCPGFIPPHTIKFSSDPNGRCTFQGQLFSRAKFLKAFFPDLVTLPPLIMTTVAALAGCDYSFKSKEQATVVIKLRRRIVTSDIGGLRVKHRNNPTAALSCTAIIRFVYHYVKKYGPDAWLRELATANCDQPQVCLDMIEFVHSTYYGPSALVLGDHKDKNPGMVDARRLLTHGVVFCYPVAESLDGRWDLFSRNNNNKPATKGPSAVKVPLPPLTNQFETWVKVTTSMWQFPHFQQVRARLYAVIRQCASIHLHGSESLCCPRWSDDQPQVVEYAREGKGKQIKMQDTAVTVPYPDARLLSTTATLDPSIFGFSDDSAALKRCLLMSLLGTSQDIPLIRSKAATRHGLAFVSSLLLPYNLAALLLLMETAPVLDMSKLADIPVDPTGRDEMDLLLPVLSVAVHHAILLLSTLKLLFPGAQSKWAQQDGGSGLSGIFDYKIAILAWGSIRLGRNVESLANQERSGPVNEAGIAGYLDDAFKVISAAVQPTNAEWTTSLHQWKEEATSLWRNWWQVFHMRDLKY